MCSVQSISKILMRRQEPVVWHRREPFTLAALMRFAIPGKLPFRAQSNRKEARDMHVLARAASTAAQGLGANWCCKCVREGGEHTMTIDSDELAGDVGEFSISRLLLMVVPALILLAGGLWYASTLIQPPPQKVVVISTGGEAGGYHAFGKLYKQHLEKEGIKVQLQTSAGSVENLQRLHDPKSGVSAAFMQGGIAGQDGAAGLVSVGRMFNEPLWIFYRSAETIDRIGQLKGLRIAVGSEGSGTRKLAMTLLGAANVSGDNTTLLPITNQPAVDALLAGQADAAMLTLAPEAPLLRALLRDQTIKLMSLSQANALSRIYPYLARVTLPQGVIDLEKNIPAKDVELVAPVAALVVRDDLHPALVEQLAQAASAIHSGPNLLTKAGEFPRAVDPEFQMSTDAERFYKNGKPFLQRYMPFWMANFLQRLILMLIPLATIALPLMRGIPAFMKWRVQRKLTYWYQRLERLEAGIGKRMAQDGPTPLEQSRELSAITDGVSAFKVPRAYAEQYFNLRGHIDMVRARLGSRPAAA